MNEEEYRKAYFAEPEPSPRFQFAETFGITLFVKAYADAVRFYGQVLGPPNYIEGQAAHGWRIGPGWLTLLPSNSSGPENVEVTCYLATPEQAEALQRAFIEAGAKGSEATDELMYEAVRSCPVTDPFGINWLLVSALG